MPMNNTIHFDCCVKDCKVELEKRKQADGTEYAAAVTTITLTIDGHDPRVGSFILKENVTATLESKDDLNFG